MASTDEAQLASAVLMIRPARFVSNPMTAASNRFQSETGLAPEQLQAQAVLEFDAIRKALEDAGVRTICVDDTPEPHTPDSIFPNNWVSFHADGRVVLYPMEAENRRTERRMDIIDTLVSEFGYHVSEIIDLSTHESEGHFLEGTGSMVLDRRNRVAYACLSSRTHLDVLADFAQRLDYEVIAFDAVDRNGDPVYHTNVLMNVGETLAVICAEAIPDVEQRNAVIQSLEGSGHEVIALTFDQLDAFAGNMLELRSCDGDAIVVMSSQAYRSLKPEQVAVIGRHARIVDAPIDTIEAAAGGSVRCMLAEIHLPTA